MFDIFRVVIFLLWVNGLPPLVAVLINDRFPERVDGDRLWPDGRPVFGPHKTIRGLVTGLFGGALAFPLLDQAVWIAMAAAMLAMTGDLLTSFIKRRIDMNSGHEAAVLDQFLEAALPLLFLHGYLNLSLPESTVILVLFISIGYCSSRLWHHITDRPVPDRYPRTIKSSVRFREWKACHAPLARYQAWFNLTSFLSDQVLLTFLFRISGLYTVGMRNALDVRLVHQHFSFKELPADFDGFTILFLTDLHLDGLPGITQKIKNLLVDVKADVCLIGGDIRMKTYGDASECIRNMKALTREISAEHGIYGVLGNHDCIEMLPDLEDAGVIMLVNDAVPITRNRSHIWVAGVDDPHYYQLDDLRQATAEIPPATFSLCLAHSPEAYRKAASADINLYLCGHTHGGQICLVDRKPIITNSRAPRFTAQGTWQFGDMHGYTSRGAAPSAIPVRFNCPGEITLITLRREATNSVNDPDET